MTPPATERWLNIDGLEFFMEDGGKGPVVLLAHGMWCDGGMFAELARDLARDYRVLVPDLRGHGRSTVPDQQWEITDLAADLSVMLDRLEVPRVTLLGFSMGGMAAVEFALRFGQRLDGLVLAGTSAAAEELVRLTEIRTLARLIQFTGKPKFLAHEAARATFSSAFRESDPAAVARWESVIGAMTGRALVHALRAVGSRPSRMNRLGEISVPTLIVTGGEDRVLKPRWSRVMHRELAQSRLVTYPGVGHAVPTERPAELAALIRGLRTGPLATGR